MPYPLGHWVTQQKLRAPCCKSPARLPLAPPPGCEKAPPPPFSHRPSGPRRARSPAHRAHRPRPPRQGSRPVARGGLWLPQRGARARPLPPDERRCLRGASRALPSLPQSSPHNFVPHRISSAPAKSVPRALLLFWSAMLARLSSLPFFGWSPVFLGGLPAVIPRCRPKARSPLVGPQHAASAVFPIPLPDLQHPALQSPWLLWPRYAALDCTRSNKL